MKLKPTGPVLSANVFKVNYEDKEAVIKLAKQLHGAVIKHSDRTNYNIVPIQTDGSVKLNPKETLIYQFTKE